MDVISWALFAAAVTLLIGLGMCDMFNVPLPGPLARLHEHGIFGVVVAALLMAAALFLWAIGPISSPDSNGRNG